MGTSRTDIAPNIEPNSKPNIEPNIETNMEHNIQPDIQISNFNISAVYKEHCLAMLHQLPRSPGKFKRYSKIKKSQKVQEV